MRQTQAERLPIFAGFCVVSLLLHGVVFWRTADWRFGADVRPPKKELVVTLEADKTKLAKRPEPPKPKPERKVAKPKTNLGDKKPRPLAPAPLLAKTPPKTEEPAPVVRRDTVKPARPKPVVMAQAKADDAVAVRVRRRTNITPRPATEASPTPTPQTLATAKPDLLPKPEIVEPTPDATNSPRMNETVTPLRLLPAAARPEPRQPIARAPVGGGSATQTPVVPKPSGGRGQTLQADAPTLIKLPTAGGGSGSINAKTLQPRIGGGRTFATASNPLATLPAASVTKTDSPNPSPNALDGATGKLPARPALGKLAGRLGAGDVVGTGVGNKTNVAGAGTGGRRAGVGGGGVAGEGNLPRMAGFGDGAGKGVGNGTSAGRKGTGQGQGVGPRIGVGKLAEGSNTPAGGGFGLAALLRGDAPGMGGKSGGATAAGTGGLGTATKTPFAMRGDIYHLPSGTARLPDFERGGMKSVGTIYATNLNVPTRTFTEGFPGVTNRFEWFAINYNGTFTISRPGTYRFTLTSDDGSKLIVDQKLVIDNDGTHGTQTKTGMIRLGSGTHNINLQYFQGPANQIALILNVVFEQK